MSDLNRRAAEIVGVRKDKRTDGLQEHDWTILPDGTITSVDFDPCNRIDHAWMLVEWLVEHGYDVQLQYTGDFDGMCWYIYLEDKQQDLDLYADTAPLAITRAFLEAVGEKK